MDFAIRFLAVGFATLIGGCLGSFLNVVVWRLPAGMSLVRPGSFCPKCRHSIRFYDNLPVLGWLLLRGRCRDCHEPISPRYPIIEALCAVLAGLFAILFFFGERGIPAGGFAWRGLGPEFAEWAKYQAGELFFCANPPVSILLHGLMATFVAFGIVYLTLAIGLIEWDGKEIPTSLMVTLAVIALGVGAFAVIGTGTEWVSRGVLFGGGAGLLCFLLLFVFFPWRNVVAWGFLSLLTIVTMGWAGSIAVILSGLLAVIVFFLTVKKRGIPSLLLSLTMTIMALGWILTPMIGGGK